MILGIKDQYPKANQSVIQKAEYEKKKFNCEKKVKKKIKTIKNLKLKNFIKNLKK